MSIFSDKLKAFFNNNKVFLLGLVGAIALALQEFLGEAAINWKVVGFSALIAGLSFIANQWRGQGVTILGTLGTLAYTFVQLQQSGTFTWPQFIISSLIAIGLSFAPAPKSVGYEKTATIRQANEDGKQITKDNRTT